MEIQLQELIDQIKKDGVETAEKEAASKVQNAEAEAEKILAEAKAEAEKIIQNAKEESDRYARVSEDSIRQAGRNLLISFRESVNKELNAIVGREVEASYSPETLTELIPNIVEAWSKNADTEDITVLLSSKELETLEGALTAKLKEKMVEGVTLKANDDFDGGFRIAVDNGRIFYDYSTEAVTDMMAAYLNPKVAALMKEAE